MFEVINDRPPFESLGYRDKYRDAVQVALDGEAGARYWIYQVADDDARTRVCEWAHVAAHEEKPAELQPFTLVLIDRPPEEAADGDFAHVVGVTLDDLERVGERLPHTVGIWFAALVATARVLEKRDAE